MSERYFTFTLPTGDSDLQRAQMVIFNMVGALKLMQQYVVEMESCAVAGGDYEAVSAILNGLKEEYHRSYLDINGMRTVGTVACKDRGNGYRIRMIIERVEDDHPAGPGE